MNTCHFSPCANRHFVLSVATAVAFGGYPSFFGNIQAHAGMQFTAGIIDEDSY
jgi:hypothetical protein